MAKITWRGAHPNNFMKGRNGNRPKHITIHWIVGSLESAAATFQNPKRISSTHYGVGENDIFQFVSEADTAFGNSNWQANLEGISIEHEGGWLDKNGNRVTPSRKTHETSAWLCAQIAKRYNWKKLELGKNVFPHRHWSNTQCPGSTDLNLIITLANRLLEPEPVQRKRKKQTMLMIYLKNGAHDGSTLYAIMEPSTGFWWEFNTYQENANNANRQVVPAASIEVSRAVFEMHKKDMAERRAAIVGQAE